MDGRSSVARREGDLTRRREAREAAVPSCERISPIPLR